MDIKVRNEKNEQVRQKQKKLGRPQISPWQYSILEDRRAVPQKTSGKANITSKCCTWPTGSSSEKNNRQIILNSKNWKDTVTLKDLLEDKF